MTKKTRIEFTNPIVTVVSRADNVYCHAIAGTVKRLEQWYFVTILPENTSFEHYDRAAHPSGFVLCPKFIKSKSHRTWSRTKFDLYYVNISKRTSDGKEVVPSGARQLLANATPLKTQQMITMLLTFSEIEEAEVVPSFRPQAQNT